MRKYIDIKWLKRTLVVLLTLSLLLSIFIVVRTATDLRSYSRSISSATLTEINIDRARNLNRDIDQIMMVANLPVIKQISQLFGLNFVPIKDEIKSIVSVAPILAGSQSPKLYLIAFQNSAEARGTGGILGAYAIIEFNKGSIKVIKTGSNEPLYGSSLEKIPIDVPNEYRKLYGENPAILQNSNLSPHFPYGAKFGLLYGKKSLVNHLMALLQSIQQL